MSGGDSNQQDVALKSIASALKTLNNNLPGVECWQCNTPCCQFLNWISNNAAFVADKFVLLTTSEQKQQALNQLNLLAADCLFPENINTVIQHQLKHCAFIDDAICRAYYGFSPVKDTAAISRLAVQNFPGKVKQLVTAVKMQLVQESLLAASFCQLIGCLPMIAAVTLMYHELRLAENLVRTSKVSLTKEDGFMAKKMKEINDHLTVAVTHLSAATVARDKITDDLLTKAQLANNSVQSAYSCAMELRLPMENLTVEVGELVKSIKSLKSTSLSLTGGLVKIEASINLPGLNLLNNIAALLQLIVSPRKIENNGIISEKRLAELQGVQKEAVNQKKKIDQLLETLSGVTHASTNLKA